MSALYLIKDADWVRQAFLVNANDLASVDIQNRTFSSASLKYVDTTPGGNLAINPPPQFTRTADIMAPGMYFGSTVAGRPSGFGMGRYYSEAIDDNAQRIYMRFGVPRFNSLTTFFTGFYDASAGEIARTGRAGGLFFSIGMAAGFIVSIISWKIVALHLLGVALRFSTGSPSSKFYYLKPTMPVYWAAVTTMVNQLAVNRGIVPRVGGRDQQLMNNKYATFSNADLMKLHNLLPDIFRENGGIDVYAMANRAQRLARIRYKQLESKLNVDTNYNLYKAVQESMNDPIADNRPDYVAYMKSWFAKPGAMPSTVPGNPSTGSQPTANSSTASAAQAEAAASGNASAPPISGDGNEPIQDDITSGFMDFFNAELDDGSAFATFRVNSTGSISESFSNSVTESELAQKINSMSSSGRSTNFSFAGGNLVGGVVGKAMGAIATAAMDLVKGVGDGLGISGLAALSGAAFVDIPKHWESSSASLPRASYTINLVSPYGNPISQLLNIDIPLAMLLAAALPIATGKQSYTSPFILELYDQGRCQTRLGMIDSLSITRGTTNLGFNNDYHAMSIDVTFSIVDMSSVLTMPINQGFSLISMAAGAGVDSVFNTLGGEPGTMGQAIANSLKAALPGSGMFDDDTVFTDYMNVLAGMSLQDQIYPWRKFKLNETKSMLAWETWTSASRWAGMAGDILPSRLYSAIYKGRGSGLIPK